MHGESYASHSFLDDWVRRRRRDWRHGPGDRRQRATEYPAHQGSVGLKSGSQPPPHLYTIAPLIYTYNTDTVKDRDGNALPFDADLTSVAFGAGVVMVTKKKIFGANYGFSVLFPVSTTASRAPRSTPTRASGSPTPSSSRSASAGTSSAPTPSPATRSIPDRPLHGWRQQQHRPRHVGPRAVGRHDGVSERGEAVSRLPTLVSFDFSRRRKTARPKSATS